MISSAGWARAMWVMAAAAAVAAAGTAAAATSGDHAFAGTTDEGGLRAQLHVAARDRSYWYLHGLLHLRPAHRLLVTHLPGEIALCGLSPTVASTSIALIGLFNIAGSLLVGALGQRYRMKYLLFWMYASRAAMIGAYLLAPPTALTFYVFSAALGFTAGHGAAHRRHGRQAVRPALHRHPVRPDPAVAPARRLLRRVAGRAGAGPLGQLSVDVVRRHGWPRWRR